MNFFKLAAVVCALTFSLLAPSVFSAPSDPMKFVPSDSTALFSIDVKKLINLPIVQDMKKNNADFNRGMLEIETKLKAQGIQLEKLADKMYIFSIDENSYGAVFSTDVKESQMEALFNEAMKTNKNSQVDSQIISGKKVFILNNNGDVPSIGAMQSKEVTVLTYLKDDIILLSTKEMLPSIYKKINASNVTDNKKFIAKKDAIDKNAIAWLIFDVPKNLAPNQSSNPMLAAYDGKVNGGSVSLTLSGQESKDIGIDATIECADAQTSAMMAMQVNAMMMFMPQNASFSAELPSAIKVQAAGNNVTAKIFMNAALQEKIKDFLSQQSAGMGMGMPMQQPGAAPMNNNSGIQGSSSKSGKK